LLVQALCAAGAYEFTADAVILATGCRERTAGMLNADALSGRTGVGSPPLLVGTRPSGVFTAGAAQRMINLGGLHLGRRAVVLGSGDIGLIVARRLTLSGTEVLCVVEQGEGCGGLPKNRRDCLEAYDIPFRARHTVTALHGNARLEAVTVAALDSAGSAIPESARRIPCDTLILSVGLVPETELLTDFRQRYGAEPPNLTVCGNARRIRTMADDIADDGHEAGVQTARLLACRRVIHR
jgi:NADPH-dependent 2,4-dienoyl-CoA reductase/sulfur reductase-like enzyme